MDDDHDDDMGVGKEEGSTFDLITCASLTIDIYVCDPWAV
jgi:hypothetical protein